MGILLFLFRFLFFTEFAIFEVYSRLLCLDDINYSVSYNVPFNV